MKDALRAIFFETESSTKEMIPADSWMMMPLRGHKDFPASFFQLRFDLGLTEGSDVCYNAKAGS